MPRVSTDIYVIQGTLSTRRVLDRIELKRAIDNARHRTHVPNIIVKLSPEEQDEIREFLREEVAPALVSDSPNALAVINTYGVEEDTVRDFIDSQYEPTYEDRSLETHTPRVILFGNEEVLHDNYNEPRKLEIVEFATSRFLLTRKMVSILRQMKLNESQVG